MPDFKATLSQNGVPVSLAGHTHANWALSHGTSFPVLPAVNDQFFRDDIGELCQYDGGRWLGARKTLTPTLSRLSPYSTAGYIYAQPVKPCIVVGATTHIYVSTTNGALNYWTISYMTDGTTILTNSTAGLSANTTYITSNALSNIITALGMIYVSLGKVGNPGNSIIYSSVDVRFIYT
jgi:hypothetical protein